MSPKARKNTSDLQSVKMWRFPKFKCFTKKTIHTRWASTTSKWSYDPYESGVVTLLVGLITPLTTSRGPPSRALRINSCHPRVSFVFVLHFCWFFGFCGPKTAPPGFVSTTKRLQSCPGVDMDAIPSPLSRSLQCLVWKPQGIASWEYQKIWYWKIMGG